MKFINLLLALVFFVPISDTEAQTINWKSIGTENKHVLNMNVGLEYGLVYGIGYGIRINSKLPVLFNIEYSFPSGNKLTDDFKTKIGGKIRLCEVRSFKFSASIQGIFRSYENDFVRLLNFGSDVSGVFGYYKSKWFLAAEFGFDKAIVTHFKHAAGYKNSFVDVNDGWYESSTGGNFYYGIQAGISFKKQDIYLKIGKVVVQNFNTTPLIPYYAQLGYNCRIGKTSK
ncbi:MAG: hypothetical protein L6Q66_09740 [Bacteroidia bacterium]|nr:hypothetical protein [Bacteroidia bacterium]